MDVPNAAIPDSTWVTVDSFDTREEALDFVQKYFGADEEGNINLITEVEDEEEEDE